MNNVSSKIRIQAIASVIFAAVAVGQAALTDGITLEGGWLAAGVGGLAVILTALGYVKAENHPPPSAVATLNREGLIAEDQVATLIQSGRMAHR